MQSRLFLSLLIHKIQLKYDLLEKACNYLVFVEFNSTMTLEMIPHNFVASSY